MVAWTAVWPAVQKALPYIGKAVGALGAENSFGGLLGGNSSDTPSGSGVTYNAQVYGGQVPTSQGNNMYSMITGQKRQPSSFYDKLMY